MFIQNLDKFDAHFYENLYHLCIMLASGEKSASYPV